MARGFGRRQRNALNTLTQLTRLALGILLYMTKGKPSSALIQLILQLWLTQTSQLLRANQTTMTQAALGSASPKLCPDCGALTPIARGCRSEWHLVRSPGKFSEAVLAGSEEREKQVYDLWSREITDPQLLVNTRTYDEIMDFTNKHLGDAITRYVASTPDAPGEPSFYENWFKQGQAIKRKYRWQYDD